jgi:cell division protein FtsB
MKIWVVDVVDIDEVERKVVVLQSKVTELEREIQTIKENTTPDEICRKISKLLHDESRRHGLVSR